MTDEIDILFERLLPETLDRFLTRAVGDAIPRLGEDRRYRVLTAGRFSGRIVPDLCTYARNQDLDAALVLVEKDVLRTLYFHEGMVVGADSNVLFERLGRILWNAEVLAEQDGDALVEVEEREGLAAAAARISPDAAHWGLERRVWEISAGLYYMPRAHFLLIDGPPDLGELPVFHIPPMDLAMEGLRRYDEWRNRSTAVTTPPPPRIATASRSTKADPLREEIDDLMRKILR